MQYNKAPGEDDIVIEAVKEVREELLDASTTLFNKCNNKDYYWRF